MIRTFLLLVLACLLILPACASRDDVMGFHEEAMGLHEALVRYADRLPANDPNRQAVLELVDKSGALADRAARIEVLWTGLNALMAANQLATSGVSFSLTTSSSSE